MAKTRVKTKPRIVRAGGRTTVTDPAGDQLPEPMLRWFVYEHLAEPMKFISKQFSHVAHDMCGRLKAGPERTVMLRKLLEAKDAAVRQQIDDLRRR